MDEMSKQDTIDYLHAVCYLEFQISEWSKNIVTIDDELNSLFTQQVYQHQLGNYSFYNFKCLLKDILKKGGISFLVFIVLAIINGIISLITGYDIPFLLLLLAPPALFIFLLVKSDELAYLRYYVKNKKVDNNNAIIFAKYEEQRLADAPHLKEELEYQREHLQNLIERASYELEQLYQWNILYFKYRSLPILFILYEYFLAGSVDTLKEAINKFDQESRWDIIIERLNKQDEINKEIHEVLLQQNELMKENIELTKQLVASSKSIERNTKITAVNTSVLLLIEEDREFRRRWR